MTKTPGSVPIRHSARAAGAFLLACALIALSPGVQAQGGARPTMVWAAATGPGGLADIFSREVAKLITDRTGQTIVVEVVSGGGGIVAGQKVRNARPDGSTFLVTSNSLIVNQAMRKNPEVDLRRDLTAVVPLMGGPFGFYVNAQIPAKTLAEFIAYAKANPGKLNYGSSGIGGVIHLVTEDFMVRNGIQMVHIPYKGGNELKLALTSNEIQLELIPLLPAPRSLPLLALTSASRLPSLPDIPTAIENGMAGFDPSWWIGIYAPAGTPAEILNRLNADVRAALNTPEMRKKYQDRDWVMSLVSPQEMQKRVEQEVVTWSRAVDAAKIPRL